MAKFVTDSKAVCLLPGRLCNGCATCGQLEGCDLQCNVGFLQRAVTAALIDRASSQKRLQRGGRISRQALPTQHIVTERQTRVAGPGTRSQFDRTFGGCQSFAG